MQKFKDLMLWFIPIGMVLLACIVSWLATCGIFYLFCWLIDWNFTWKIATAIWIVISVLKSVISSGKSK